MPTDEIIIRLFCMVDDQLGPVNKRLDAHLYPSEIVTIGLLFALKGGRFRAFESWLNKNYRAWFPHLPERSGCCATVPNRHLTFWPTRPSSKGDNSMERSAQLKYVGIALFEWIFCAWIR